MSFFKKLFGSPAEPGLFAGSPEAVPAHSHASATPSMPEMQGQDYFNKDWNFGVTIPKGWRVIFENESGNPWMQPLRIAGPKVSRGQPFLSVLVAVVQEDGKGLQAYMDKAERDLDGAFGGFALDGKRETSLLGFPMAWMTYGYRVDSGPRKEINATAFFGRGRHLLFQFICETDSECERQDFPIFERIISSLHVGSAGIRHPNVIMAGKNECELCHKEALSTSKRHAVLNLKLGFLISVCDSCLDAPQTAPAPVMSPSKARPKTDAPTPKITTGEFSFASIPDLLGTLENTLLPGLERAAQTDIDALHITAQVKRRDLVETDMPEFRGALRRMVNLVADDISVQRWRVIVSARVAHVAAISNDQAHHVVMFLIDKNNQVYCL